jgi:diguanylate cyclase (GGDEF)-like protein/PAS domain S-box-containing protein
MNAWIVGGAGCTLDVTGMEAEVEGRAEQRLANGALDELLLAPSEILEGLPDAVVAAAADGRIVFVNTLATQLFGYAREELLGQSVQILWPERVRARYTSNMELYLSTGRPLRFTNEAWGLRRDGSEFVGEMSWGIVESTAGPLLLAVGRDISTRRAVEARLRALAAMGERALTGSDPAVLAADALEVMRSTLALAGAEVRLGGGSVVASTGHVGEDAMRLPIASGDELLVTPERELSHDDTNLLEAVAHILGAALTRLRSEERTRHDAVHDPLTGLANRTLLRDRLEQALARSERKGNASGLLFVDLDNFKNVNDEYGHATGDAVLVELGKRLQSAVRPTDTVARLGGDEFVVVCEELDEETAFNLGRRLHEAIQLPVTVDGVEHRVSASIGIALGDTDADALLGNADSAAYRAKAHGRGRVELFN